MNGAARAVSVIAIAASIAGCGHEPRPSSSRAPSFTAGVCTSISEWSSDIVDAANAFTNLSPSLSIEGRRAQYLFAFDKQARITDELRDQIDAAPSNGVDEPSALRDALHRAIDDVLSNIADNKADAAANVDFHFIGPRPDRLFAGTEKSLSLLLKPLDELSRTHRIDALGGSCGR